MGYKGYRFFSLDMYRELVKPVQKRACNWAKAKGIKVWRHSCGDYIASSDHAVPQSVSLETFRESVRLAKEMGSCE